MRSCLWLGNLCGCKKKVTGWRSGLVDFGYEGMRANQRGHCIDNVVTTMYKHFEKDGLSSDENKQASFSCQRGMIGHLSSTACAFGQLCG